jgi:hypothetical protein
LFRQVTQNLKLKHKSAYLPELLFKTSFQDALAAKSKLDYSIRSLQAGEYLDKRSLNNFSFIRFIG